jgi:beta-galactosidase
MTRVSFNRGWTVRDKVSIFAGLQGGGPAPVPVRLPHDAALATDRRPDLPGGSASGYVPGGVVEYRKSFDVPEEWRAKRVSLELEGVYRDAAVYVNGDFAGQRPSGYTPFTVPLDASLRYGETNEIRVDARAHDDSRWYSGLGIHRDTFLIVTAPVHLTHDGIAVTTPEVDDDTAVVVVDAVVVNDGLSTETVMLDTEVRDDTGSVVARASSPVTVRPGDRAAVRQRLYVDEPRRWGVDAPVLYAAATVLSSGDDRLDDRETAFGIRTLQLDPAHGLRINGEPVKLRGACLHHDNGPLGAAAIARAEERRVELLKQAGFNAIRSAHNPLSRAMLDACDRIGMLVMDETFDVWAESKSAHDYSLAFPEWWERDVEAMVVKDRNHPSVIFYSIGNEIPETGSAVGSIWGRRLAEKVRSLDSTRFVTNAINGFVSVLPDVMAGMAERGADAGEGGVNALFGGAADFMNQVSASQLVTDRTRESADLLDAVGYNYGDSRYELDRELFPARVVIGSETFPGRIDVNWRLVEDNAHVLGDFTWTGWDYLGEVGIGRLRYADEQAAFAAPYPWRVAWCGDIDITGHRRPASYFREIVFGLRHEPYIAVRRPEHHGREAMPGQWSWSDAISSWTWDAAEGDPITVEVYSDADEVELLLNGSPVGRAPVGRDHGFRTEFELGYAPGELIAVAYRDGVERSRSALRSASGEAGLAVTADRTRLRDDDGELAFVAIELRDAAGVLVTDRDRPVTVEVAGAAELQALGSGRPDTDESYTAPRHTTFDGRALAVVRPTGAGAATVTVTAEGCTPVSLELQVDG